MAKATKPKKKPIEQYEHKDKERLNNPPVGLVNPDTDPDIKAGVPKKTYAYDPHLDPQLVWAGKAEHTSFEIPTVSLHVHERIDPRTIIEAVRKKNGQNLEQMSLFSSAEENPPLRNAIEFYKHAHNWSNRLVAGDSLLVMNSLLEKEGMAGKVQMIYIDPPYGIKYGSNFQPFVNKRDVKDGKDEDLTAEPEMIKAFRDTWELGIHSYLTYLRDRLLLARELLTESGSIFVQISDENVHSLRELMDEVFGRANFMNQISFKRSSGFETKFLPSLYDLVLWYCKDRGTAKYHQIYMEKGTGELTYYDKVQLPNGKILDVATLEGRIPDGAKFLLYQPLVSAGDSANLSYEFTFEGKKYHCGVSRHWKTSKEGLTRLASLGRIYASENTLKFVRYHSDYPATELNNVWGDTVGLIAKNYAVETNPKVIQRCMLMTTDPGDLVFDPTCGSGTTAYVAEQWGRRWITCDTSRVAITLAKQRLMTAMFEYYELAHPDEGVGSGFRYKTVPHVTLKSIANNEPPAQETLYDQPYQDNSRTRVTGPFTMEAVPAPVVKPIVEPTPSLSPPYEGGESAAGGEGVDMSIARSGETLRHAEWRAELLKSGIRGKNGQYILFSRVEPLSGTRWLHAEAETKPNDRGANTVREPMPEYKKPQRVVISFGPEHAPLEQRQVELAWEEARTLVPRPSIVVFAAFQFDPEAAKDIDELDPKKVGMILLKAQMNADLLTDDLKKKRTSSDSFWLMGQPDVKISTIKSGENKGKHQVEVLGFDYYNTKTGTIESGGTERIAMWMLDTDYDGRSLFPRQVFFPMAAENEGWSKLARNLKAEIDEELIEAYRGTVSLPFEPGKYKRIAVKIVDDRGIESLKVMEID
ncbi:MAG: site-specific DNA-methyltransferase [Ignavibacteriae bacterium]|nr:site-specific DNA-methyltransferase [Ignavibacteriota bacterium]